MITEKQLEILRGIVSDYDDEVLIERITVERIGGEYGRGIRITIDKVDQDDIADLFPEEYEARSRRLFGPTPSE